MSSQHGDHPSPIGTSNTNASQAASPQPGRAPMAMVEMQCLLSMPSSECYQVYRDGQQRHLASGPLVLHRIGVPSIGAPDAPPLYDIVLLAIGGHFQVPLLHYGRAWRCSRWQWMVPVAGECPHIKLVLGTRTSQEHIAEWQRLLEQYTTYDTDAWVEEEDEDEEELMEAIMDPLPSYEYALLEKSVRWRLAGWASDWMVDLSGLVANRLRQTGNTVGTLAYLITRKLRQQRGHVCDRGNADNAGRPPKPATLAATNAPPVVAVGIRKCMLAMARHTGQLTYGNNNNSSSNLSPANHNDLAIVSTGQSATRILSQTAFGHQREMMAYSSALHRIRGQMGKTIDILYHGAAEGMQSAAGGVFECFAALVEYRYGSDAGCFVREAVNAFTQQASVKDK
ncbi:hypothetical protein SYNPS1DRAFT_26607 [Syncephalis pseudoplumigaleata]|uniref:Uncharacterized protein n=1 Tax=Syncephalis pseudoplumigaleata TaxID=1712513 RepID=A0A4P9Z6H7_9FUNG|nr:hypothetical protein SYNPS1DRAFT_26607 [Syncephalis pseudoplumigaleata]|eukprot:RKP27762.1 hypothetical protein SYNPS1DRAFT_26607 [Syncephalis pseudoplumigaleata]